MITFALIYVGVMGVGLAWLVFEIWRTPENSQRESELPWEEGGVLEIENQALDTDPLSFGSLPRVPD